MHVSDPASFTAIYLTDGGSTLAVVGVLTLLPARDFNRPASRNPPPGNGEDVRDVEDVEDVEDVTEAGRGGYREVLGDGRMRRYLVTATLSAFAGYGAISAGYVGFATTVVHVAPRTIAWGFGANTMFIVITQPIGLRIAARMRRTTALSVVAVAFAMSWAVLGLACARARFGSRRCTRR